MSTPLRYGLKATFQLLETTRNDAAVSVLVHGLKLASPETRELAVRALVRRDSPCSWKAVARNWSLIPRDSWPLFESHRPAIAKEAREFLLSDETSVVRSAVQIVADIELTDCYRELVSIACDEEHLACDEARRAILNIARRLHDRLKQGKDIPSIRTHMQHALRDCLDNYEDHRCAEIVDAWIMTCSWDDAPLRSILSQSSHPLFPLIHRRLRHSRDSYILSFLAMALGRRSISKDILEILAERPDSELAMHLIHRYIDKLDEQSRRQFRQSPPFQCLKSFSPEQFRALDHRERLALSLIRSANESSATAVLENAVQFAQSTDADECRLAAKLLRLVPSLTTEEICRAFAPTAEGPYMDLQRLLTQVMKWREHPIPQLRHAASDLFAECRLSRLLTEVQFWTRDLCFGLGRVICEIDPDLMKPLSSELANPAPRRRISAIKSLVFLDRVQQYRSILAELINDPRDEVRIAAIETLATDMSDEVTRLLRIATVGVSSASREAAEEALQIRERFQNHPASPPVQLPLSTLPAPELPTADLSIPPSSLA